MLVWRYNLNSNRMHSHQFKQEETNQYTSKLKLKASNSLIQSDDELKQLWIACYFERRL